MLYTAIYDSHKIEEKLSIDLGEYTKDEDECIIGIKPNTKLKDLGITSNGTIEIYNGETKLGNDDIVGTGCVLRAAKGTETEEQKLLNIAYALEQAKQ